MDSHISIEIVSFRSLIELNIYGMQLQVLIRDTYTLYCLYVLYFTSLISPGWINNSFFNLKNFLFSIVKVKYFFENVRYDFTCQISFSSNFTHYKIKSLCFHVFYRTIGKREINKMYRIISLNYYINVVRIFQHSNHVRSFLV